MVVSLFPGGLSEVLTLFTHRDTIIFAEDPTYFLALLVFDDHALRTESVGTDDRGIKLDEFERKLLQFRTDFARNAKVANQQMPRWETHRYDFVLYLCPTYSNPSGITLSGQQRIELVRIARQYEVLVISDGEAWYNKLLGPGLRMGWIESATEIIKRIAGSGINESGGAPQHFTANIVSHLMGSGAFEPHVAWTREKLRSRCKAMLEGFAWLSENWAVKQGFRLVTEPTGGYFAWLIGPANFSSSKLWAWLKVARKDHPLDSTSSSSTFQLGSQTLCTSDVYVSFAPGDTFSVSKTKDNCIRLCFAFYPEDKLKEGGIRLGKIVKGWIEAEVVDR
ncbi:hypothetical protein HDU93_002440 [Gonapodya sp. JEL0774]|nr:hypothetical protein HDU93_002440 [Gonapodya sp. JEL0774]